MAKVMYVDSFIERHRIISSLIIPFLMYLLYRLVCISTLIILPDVNTVYITMVIDCVFGALTIWYCLYTKLAPSKLTAKKIPPIYIFGGFILCILSTTFGQSASSIIATSGIDAAFSHYTDVQMSVSLFELIVLTSIIAPVFEEAMFRWCLFGQFARLMPVPVAAVISSLMFAFGHGTIVHLPMTFMVGMLLCWIYAKTGNILLSILWHMFTNLITVLFRQMLLPDIFESSLFVAIGYGVILAVILIMLCSSPKFKAGRFYSIPKLILGDFYNPKRKGADDDCIRTVKADANTRDVSRIEDGERTMERDNV